MSTLTSRSTSRSTSTSMSITRTKALSLSSCLYAILCCSQCGDAFSPQSAVPHNVNVGRTMLHMSAEVSEVQSQSNSTSEQQSESEWWESFELKDASLASSTKSDFPILSTSIQSDGQSKPLLYFDSAATSQKPTFVTDALTSYYNTINSNVHRGAHSLSRAATSKYEAARDSIRSLINAPSRNEIIFTSGATEALNLVASSYGRANVQHGDEIIITELEHHSNIVPWQILAQEKGAVLKYLPYDPKRGRLDLTKLESLLSHKTKIVSFQHVSNVLGCIHPLQHMIPLIRSQGHPDVKIVLDACQSVPHMKVDVSTLGVDFLAASGHKMCGPTGIGFLWGKEDVLNSMPPYMGGGEMIDEVYMDRSTYAMAPARFEAGTPSIAQAIGLGAAIEYLEGTVGGMDRIEAYEKELGAYFRRRMEEVEGVTVLGPGVEEERSAIVSFVCDGVHPSDLSTFLDMEGVAVRAGHHCCQPLHRAAGISHSARASLYFYNTKEEVDIFIHKLKDTIALLGGAGSDDGSDGDDDDFVPFF